MAPGQSIGAPVGANPILEIFAGRLLAAKSCKGKGLRALRFDRRDAVNSVAQAQELPSAFLSWEVAYGAADRSDLSPVPHGTKSRNYVANTPI
jgi:hypothetical protein